MIDKILTYAPEHLLDVDLICGMDEVGRGCGAGPVVTAAVILPKDFASPLLRDSKVLSEKQRNYAYDLILDKAIAVNCTHNSAKNIDSLGLNPATFASFHNSVSGLSVQPTHILLDGNVSNKILDDYVVETVVKGDDTFRSIAAASIIAKVRRDRYMTEIGKQFPLYRWDSNKGYLSKVHIDAIKEHGITQYHRKSFLKNII